MRVQQRGGRCPVACHSHRFPGIAIPTRDQTRRFRENMRTSTGVRIKRIQTHTPLHAPHVPARACSSSAQKTPHPPRQHGATTNRRATRRREVDPERFHAQFTQAGRTSPRPAQPVATMSSRVPSPTPEAGRRGPRRRGSVWSLGSPPASIRRASTHSRARRVASPHTGPGRRHRGRSARSGPRPPGTRLRAEMGGCPCLHGDVVVVPMGELVGGGHGACLPQVWFTAEHVLWSGMTAEVSRQPRIVALAGTPRRQSAVIAVFRR